MAQWLLRALAVAESELIAAAVVFVGVLQLLL